MFETMEELTMSRRVKKEDKIRGIERLWNAFELLFEDAKDKCIKEGSVISLVEVLSSKKKLDEKMGEFLKDTATGRC